MKLSSAEICKAHLLVSKIAESQELVQNVTILYNSIIAMGYKDMADMALELGARDVWTA